MSNFVRRIVSGDKARFKDHELDIELDLVYVTDHVIIMGFPAAGVESFYRNRREDAKKFLEHRHGKNFWVYNFCPLRENSYPASLFDGRVSRYPFPDHHAPPLAVLPLVARDIREWLSGSSDRVAVLHCKAGKGRSGTLACAYLMSLDESASPPMLARNLTKEEWAQQRADRHMETVVTEDMSDTVRAEEDPHVSDEKVIATDERPLSASLGPNAPRILVETPTTDSPKSLSPVPKQLSPDSANPASSSTNNLQNVLALHSSRRMKASSSSPKKAKQGVSIPSQRRWLFYWSLILAHDAPLNLWSLTLPTIKPKVRLREIKVCLRELTGLKLGLLKAANQVIERTSKKKTTTPSHGSSQLWISLARYNDQFVDLLEKWEKHTRDESGKMGKRKREADYMNEEALAHLFRDGKWDNSKMIRSFARLGDVGEKVEKIDDEKNGRMATYKLQPLSDRKWKAIKHEIENDVKEAKDKDRLQPGIVIPSTSSSVTELEEVIEDNDQRNGIILDAEREVRAKLYIGQVFMGWLWFIPAFHMPQPPPNIDSYSSSTDSHKNTVTHFVLTRKEIDFAIGIGAAIVDVDIAMEWIPSLDAEAKKSPPPTQTSADSLEGKGGEPAIAGIMTGLQSAVEGTSAREGAEVVEAAEQ